MRNLSSIITPTSIVATALTLAQEDMRAFQLSFAELQGSKYNMYDGFTDPYNDQTGINTALSINQLYDTTNFRYYGNNTYYGTPISGGDGATHGASLAFDGSTSTFWDSSQTGTSISGAAYIGQNFGSGNAYTITQILLTTFSNAAYNISSVLVQYSDNGTTWTTNQTTTISTTTNSTITIIVTGTPGAHQYWRLLANANLGAGCAWSIPELAFCSIYRNITLISNTFSTSITPSTARLVLQIDSASVSFTSNTDLIAYASRDGGTTFVAGTISLIETLEDGTMLYDTGSFSIATEPSGSSMVYKIVTANNKGIYIDGIIFQWG